MLKMAAPPERSTFDRLEVNEGENSNGVSSNTIEIAKKSGKPKDQILSKSRKSAKSRKNLSKSGNSPNLDVKDNRLSFLTLKARAAFNRL